MQKRLTEISLPITEEEYRNDGCVHYSTLAKFARTGFHSVAKLSERVESPSLTNGSAVDSLITGGEEEFNARFAVVDIPALSPNMARIINGLYDNYGQQYLSLELIPSEILVKYWDMYDGRNWKAETKVKNIITDGSNYYKLKFISEGKTIITTEDYELIKAQVKALKESPSTRWYFEDDNPFDGIERYYQLKFRTTKNNITYSCMMDLAIVDHPNKIIYPIDLKTSSHYEDEFYKSFIDWSYDIQARSYWRNLRDNMDKDSYFKDFELADYRFIVVNKFTLTPLVWIYPNTKKYGTLTYGLNSNIICRDPYDLAEELKFYMDNEPKVQRGVVTEGENNLEEWLNKM